MQITYKDKVTLQSNSSIPDENKVTAEDMNEIKSAVNSNEEEQQALTLSVQEIAQNVVNNSQEISNIKEEQITQNNRLSSLESDNTENKANIQENANNINQLSRRVQTNETNIASLQLESGNTLELSLNNTTYELTATLKNKAGTILSTSKVDFPVEQLVISVTYDSAKKELVITLKNGQVTRVPIGSIINGLVNQSDFDALVQTVQTKANQSDLNQTNTNVTNLAGRVSNNESKIENIEQEQTTQNTNISNNATNIESLQEENDNLKKIVSQLPQVTGQGTEITLENTIEAPFTKFDVEGNSTQETTEGKNLANIHVITNLSNQFFSRQIVGDTIVLSNNTNASGFLTTEKKLNEICPNLKVDDIVKLSFKTTSTTANPKNAIYLEGINQLWNINGVKTITQEMLDSRVILYGGYNETAVISEFMIRLSSITDDTYEKFTYGASPNPNYEQPIYSAGDNENDFNPELAEEKKYQNIDGNYSIATHPLTWISGLQSIESSKNYVLNHQAQTGAFYDENRNVIKSSPIYQSNTFQTPSNAKYVNLTFAPSIVTFDDKDNIKLEKGNKASGYSPYGMGSINEKIQNKNKMTYPLDFEITNNGIRSKQAKGTYNLNGTTTSSGNFLVQQNFIKSIKIQSGDYLHIMNSSANSNVAMILCFSDGSIDSAGLITANRIYDLSNSVGKTLVGIRFYCNSANINISINLTPMIINNSTSTPYVEHKEQDYPIFVQQPMRSIGDVRDKFVKVNGNWFERHYIGRKILNGTELVEGGNADGGTEGVSKRFYITHNLTNLVPANTYDKLMCSNFVVGSTYGNDNTLLQLSATLIYIRINVNDYSNLQNKEQVKAWLAEQYASGNPVYVDYILATPQDLPCTEEQIEVLENMPSTYKEMTIINSEDETKAYLEVSGIRDINTMFDKVTNAIVSLGGNV